MIFCWQWLSEPRIHLEFNIIYKLPFMHIKHTTLTYDLLLVSWENLLLWNLWPPSQLKVQMSFNSNFTLRFLTSFPLTHFNAFPNLYVVLPNSETCTAPQRDRQIKEIKYKVVISEQNMGYWNWITTISKKNPLLDSFIFFDNWPKNLPKKFGSTHSFIQSFPIGTPG